MAAVPKPQAPVVPGTDVNIEVLRERLGPIAGLRVFTTWAYTEPDKPGKKPRKKPLVPAGPQHEDRRMTLDEAVLRRNPWVAQGAQIGIGIHCGPIDDSELVICATDFDNGREFPENFEASWPSYLELSPSGSKRGLALCTQEFKACRGDDIEFYSHGRFMTLTGYAVNDEPVGEIDPALVAGTLGFDLDTSPPTVIEFKPKRHVNVEELTSALSVIPSADYARWADFGHAIKHDCGDAGFELWATWSAESFHLEPSEQDSVAAPEPDATPADEETCRKKWDRDLKPNGKVTTASIFHIAKTCYGWEPPSIVSDDGRLQVQLYHGRDFDNAMRVGSALLTAGAPYFMRGPALVRVVETQADEKDDSTERPKGSPYIVAPSGAMLSNDVSMVIELQRFDARTKELVPTSMTASLAASVQAAAQTHQWCPPIRGIAAAPLLRLDGSLHDERGYDMKTCWYLQAGDWKGLDVPDRPTEAQARAALKWIEDEVYCDFKFVSPVHRACALALSLGALVKHLCVTTPLTVIGAQTYGEGKTKLGHVSALIVFGRKAVTMTAGKSEDELSKRIDTAAIMGDPIVMFSNFKGRIADDTLAERLTSEQMGIRVFGRNDTLAVVPNASTWIIEGTEIEVARDIVRRTIRIALNSKTEFPHLRTGFRHPDLEAWVAEHRVEILSKFYTALRWHLQTVDELPGDFVPLGTFVQWSRIVEGCLVRLGYERPISTQEELAAIDSEREEMVSLLELLREYYESKGAFQIRDLVAWDNLDARTLLAEATGSEVRDLSARAIGNFFKHRLADRILAGLLLERDDLHLSASTLQTKAAKWRVVRVSFDGAGTPVVDPKSIKRGRKF